MAHDVAAAIGRVHAQGDVELGVGIVPFRAGAVLSADLDAFEVALVDDVHHAGHGVGAVCRGSTAGEDVDALDELRRDRVHVHRGVARHAGDEATAIDQDQRPGGAQVTKVDRGHASAGDQEVGVGAAEGRRTHGRVLQQQLLDVGDAGRLDVFRADDLQR